MAAKTVGLLLFILFLLYQSAFPTQILATSWVYSFVVWDGHIYVVSDENVIGANLNNRIGNVTSYSNMKQYSGNFSNSYEEGTSYYSILGIDTSEAIAIEVEEEVYIKAYREGRYEYADSIFNRDSGGFLLGFVILFLLTLGVIAFVIGNRVKQQE